MSMSFQIRASNPVSNKLSISLSRVTHKFSFLAMIGESINAQPAVHKSYPILPSAPLHDHSQQNYGSISEIIQSQPVANTIVILPANACPICRIGESESFGNEIYD